MYHDSDNNVVSEPGRFGVWNSLWHGRNRYRYRPITKYWMVGYAYEARPYRTQSHAIPYIRYEYSNSLIGIANIISYTVYAYIYIILLPEWHRHLNYYAVYTVAGSRD